MAATDLKAKLLAPGFSPTGSTAAMSDPIADTPLVLSIDEVLPWEDNPRTTVSYTHLTLPTIYSV